VYPQAKERRALGVSDRYRAQVRAGLFIALAVALGACSADLSLNNVTLVKPEALPGRPNWAPPSFERPLTAADLVNKEGQCSESSASPAPATLGGISLRMSECEVVQRAGPVESIELGATERGERLVTLTYLSGPAPGIYRFINGRLISIDRAPTPPEPEKPQKAGKATKKPAGT